MPFLLPKPLLIAGVCTVLVLAVGSKVPLRYIVRNLLVRWKTTLMTAGAFTLVVALLTVMLAFVNGMYRLTEATGQPGNLIVLSDGATDEIFSNLSPADIGDIANQPGIVRAGGRRLASAETYLVVNQPIRRPRPGGPERRFLQLRGLDDAPIAAAVHNLRLYPGGQWLSEAGVEELPAQTAAGADKRPAPKNGQRPTVAIETVLGEGIARVLARDRTEAQRAAARDPQRLAVGDVFHLGERAWLVVGVMQSAGSTFDSEVWAKRSVIAPMFGKETYSSVVVRAPDEPAARRLKEFFTKGYKKAALQAQLEVDYFRSLSETNRQFLYAIAFVVVVMSGGGIFGVMNTMFAAISQRTRDLGVMRLLGFARWQILAALLLESLLIALVGGLLGCALGSMADGWTATSIVSGQGFGGKFVVLRLAVDARILATGMLVSLAMGFLGGLLPALSALRLRALEALR